MFVNKKVTDSLLPFGSQSEKIAKAIVNTPTAILTPEAILYACMVSVAEAHWVM